MDYDPNPSLSSILATLSAYAPPPQQPPPPASYQTLQPPAHPAPIHPPHQALVQIPPHPASAYEPPPATTTYDPPPPTTYDPAPPPPTHHPYSPPSPTPQPPLLPTTSITTWPPALRHTLSLAQNQDTMHRIRHLIQEQHNHERTWWRGREELVRKQRGRGEARGRLDGVLKGLGGHVAASTHLSDPEADKRELERYDKKVHSACGEMIAATEKELTALGVPFFGVRGELMRRKVAVPNDGGEGDGRIGEEELKGLKGKMVELLEDLCKD